MPGSSFRAAYRARATGQQSRWRKIDTFRGIRARLATPSDAPRILCGDFNEPRTQGSDSIETWAGYGRWSRVNPERWKQSVFDVLTGLADHDLSDVFRALHRGEIAQ